MEAVQRAKMCNRAVSLQASSRYSKKWPKIFALPGAPLKFKEKDSMTENFLIFGPYMRQSNSNLLLMQNVDGELMLRDEYERRNFIKRTIRTRCLWIYANTLKCIHDADPCPLMLTWNKNSTELGISSSTSKTDVKNDPKNSMKSSNVGLANGEDESLDIQE